MTVLQRRIKYKGQEMLLDVSGEYVGNSSFAIFQEKDPRLPIMDLNKWRVLHVASGHSIGLYSNKLAAYLVALFCSKQKGLDCIETQAEWQQYRPAILQYIHSNLLVGDFIPRGDELL